MRRTLLCALATAACLGVTGAATSAATVRDAAREQPVTFTVQNSNDSALACATDGGTYTIYGHLNATAAELRSGKVTLLLHGLGLGEFFWRAQVPGYDFARQLADQGHASVTIDRLGYGRSGKPAGSGSCIGGQATIAHQIIGDLKDGDYAGAAHPAFANVGEIGHSAGGQITEVESYSFHDATAIGVLAYSDSGISPFQTSLGDTAAALCAQGGEPQGVTFGAPGYAPLGTSLPLAIQAFLHSASVPAAAALLPHVSLNPCGDLASYTAAPATDLVHLSSITQPVLLVQGGQDMLFPPPAVHDQATRFTGSQGVTYAELPQAGHALTYESVHDRLVGIVAGFLHAHGL